MAGPVGTTPPMLDGGEWTHLIVEGATHSRARRAWFVLRQNRWRGKKRSQLAEENNRWLAARPQALRLWPVKKGEDFA